MSFLEQHYNVAEIAKMLGRSKNTIRRLFSQEKGVLKIGSPETRFKRKRWTLCIPESALRRVFQKLEQAS